MTGDLVAFLHARYDEDEKTAREAPAGPWQIGNAVDPTQPCNVNTFPDLRMVADGLNWLAAEHIAHHNPARVLRDVDAHRRLLDDTVSGWEQAAPGKIERNLRQHRGPRSLIDPVTGEEEVIKEWTVTRQLRLLALPYADHPDYQEHWRP